MSVQAHKRAHKTFSQCVSFAIKLYAQLAQLPGSCVWSNCLWQIINEVLSISWELACILYSVQEAEGLFPVTATCTSTKTDPKVSKINPNFEGLCTKGENITRGSKCSHTGDIFLYGSWY